MKLNKIEWEPVDSSNLESIYFHQPSNIVCVRFLKGGLYSYQLDYRLEIQPSQIFLNFQHAESVGKYLNNVIKAFPYSKWDTEAELLEHLNA